MKMGTSVIHAVAIEDAPEFFQSGTGTQWREHVGSKCVANSRLMLAVSTAFAAPLLYPTKTEPGGIHLFGASSCGKSTALQVAASVIGPPSEAVRGWHSTGAAIEAIAARCNDGLLILDELGQCHPEAAASVVYTLTSGGGKERSKQDGALRDRHKFRVLLLSSGEPTFPDFLRQAGKRPFTGQEIRLLDIPADAGCGLGAFEHLHGVESPAEFSDQLKRSTALYHGRVLHEYLEKLVNDENADHDGLLKRISGYSKQFFAECSAILSPGYSGQVHRVATRLALIAGGGELASHYGVTGWDAGEAIWAARRCFEAWLERRDTPGQQESHNLLQQCTAFLETHGESRFTPLEGEHRGPAPRTINRAGWKRTTVDAISDRATTEYFVTTSAFKEMCLGFEHKWAANILVQRGIINPDKSGSSSSGHHIPGEGTKRVYHFPAAREYPDPALEDVE